ncbi:MAG: TonB family protein [Acidobacteria bacterium]|nr:TonB family protein [Acidobacteriota bacterium]
MPGLGGSLLGSILLHVALALLLWISPMIFPPRVLILGAGTGGGPGGDLLQVGLRGALDGGSGELFKPSPRPEPPAAPMPEQARQSEPAEPRPDDFQVEGSKKKPARTAAVSTAKPKAQLPSQPNQIPREPSPGTGSSGGGGQGVHIGGGSGGQGVMDSWYARQVEKRIGENWLRTNFESLAGKQLTTVIQFDILPDGNISGVVVQQRSGVTFYDLAAERAIRSSTPLPRPPAEFQGRAIRFICYFEYPPPGGL